MNYKISVVILTARRPEKLREALESLSRQTFSSFEVVIVDNAPSNQTDEIAGTFNLSCRVIKNHEAVSFAEARNLGIGKANGDFIAFMDDDCIADPAWLEHFCRRITEEPEIDALGGLVLPYRRLKFPEWWVPSLGWLIGCTDSGFFTDKAGSVSYPHTSNMMVRQSTLLEHPFQEIGGGFQLKKSRNYAGREDAELWRRLRLEGCHCGIERRSVVYHDIPQERLRFKYLLRRAYNDGAAFYRRSKQEEYLEWAYSDIFRLFFRLIKNLLTEPKPRKKSTEAMLWFVRQAGWAVAFFRDDPLNNFFKIARIKIKIMAGLTIGLFKKTLRRQLVNLYRRKKRRRIVPKSPNSILFCACGYLGDMFLISPILQSLRESLPNTHITLLCHGNGYILYENSDLVNDIIKCPPGNVKLPQGQSSALKDMFSSYGYEVVLIPYYHNAPPQAVFFGVESPVVTFHQDVGFQRRIWYDLAEVNVRKDFTRNEIENLYTLAGKIGDLKKPHPYTFQVPSEAVSKAERKLKEFDISEDNLILFHAGAGEWEKTWPVENWDVLADHVFEKWNTSPVFIGDEKVDKKIRRLSCIRDEKAINMCFQGDLWLLVALIQKGKLLVTNDSGPKHIAIFQGTPTITLYGYSDERRWGALWDRGKHLAVRGVPADLTPEECMGQPGNFAITRITPQMVMKALQNLRY